MSHFFKMSSPSLWKPPVRIALLLEAAAAEALAYDLSMLGAFSWVLMEAWLLGGSWIDNALNAWLWGGSGVPCFTDADMREA